MIYVRRSAAVVLFLILLLVLSAFGLLSFRDGEFDIGAVAMGVAACVVFIALYNILKNIFKHIDRYVLILCILLFSVGLIIQYRLNPQTAWKQFVWFIAGIFALTAALLIIKNADDFGKWNIVFLGGTAGLLLLSLLFARVIGGAKNWIDLGVFTMQPSEFAKLLFIITAAYYFSRKKNILGLLPYIGFCGACIFILVLSKDLGAGILYAMTLLVMFFAGTGKALWTLGGVGILGGGAYASYKLFSHVRTRVEIWQDPWSAGRNEGYQIVQGLMAIASGSLLGMGLNLGSPTAIPASHTDFIFAVICEEFGIIIGIAVIIFYLLFILRGALIALNARTKFHQLLVFGCTAMLSLQCFVIIAGVIKMIPLTGITLPFISYGGSSMVSCMALVGIIEGVAVKNGETDESEIKSIGGEVL
jgi:cell division protein FtsW (lipid II flippase)